MFDHLKSWIKLGQTSSQQILQRAMIHITIYNIIKMLISPNGTRHRSNSMKKKSQEALDLTIAIFEKEV